jgi:alkylation response protein AidB-like acyl-CoA dehydrogenase
MNFDLSEDQKALVTTVSAFARKESPITRMRRLREDPLGFERATFQKMGEYGWLGVLFPEDAGGSGGSFVDAALVLEQLGATLVPEPVIPAFVAGTALQRAGSPEQRQRFLTPLAGGETVLSLAFAEAQSRHEPRDVATRAVRSGSGWKLSGEKRWVLAGHAASAFVVSARTSGGDRDADGISLFVVDSDAPGVSVQSLKTMDGRRAAHVRFDGVEVGADRLLGTEGQGRAALEAALDVGAAACCAEGVGVTQAMLHMTVEYLKVREQFGVKIGSFQALQHRAVDMFVEAELCRSMSIMASIKVDSPDEVERKTAVSAAKVQLAVGGRFLSQQAIQLHGGIGITDEHDVGLYFKRMHALNTLFGDEEHHLSRFATLPSFTEALTRQSAA